MNDKERILMEIIRQLDFTTTLDPSNRPWGSEAYRDGSHYRVHFAPWNEPQVGDLVMCQTGPINDFFIGFVHVVIADNRCLIREIGSGRLCDVSNERFVPIVGMPSISLLEGDQREFYRKTLAAFERGDEVWYRFNWLEFDGPEAVIWVRERYGGALKNGSKPFSVRMRWNKKTTIKAILQALRDGGYGSRQFEPNDPPDE